MIYNFISDGKKKAFQTEMETEDIRPSVCLQIEFLMVWLPPRWRGQARASSPHHTHTHTRTWCTHTSLNTVLQQQSYPFSAYAPPSLCKFELLTHRDKPPGAEQSVNMGKTRLAHEENTHCEIVFPMFVHIVKHGRKV